MITYAESSNSMAFLIKSSKSEVCKIYQGGRCLIIFLKIVFLFGLSSTNFTLAGEGVTIPMDISTWSYKGDKFECNLVHSTVPQGKFYFRAEPNNRVLFIADVQDNNNKWEKAVLESQSAPWHKELYRKEKASHTFAQPTHRFEFLTGADSLILEMASGNWVTLSLSGSNPSAIDSVTLPTIQIQHALASFNQCREQLPKLSFSQARDLILPFQFGQQALNSSQKNTLAALHSYVVVDERVTKILVDGYTDNVGAQLINLKISRQRAQQVADELIANGIAPHLIEVRAHGARYPIASNNTQAGQAKNRRVTLRLVRDNERVITKNEFANNNSEVKQQPQQEKVKVQ
ncbi:MotY family protein [Vibrio jasicida]|uniref:OmpA family protein n=1 Tax=Vibrio jasicida TaxID=766224 RepID=A0ABW7JHK0_9VIBR